MANDVFNLISPTNATADIWIEYFTGPGGMWTAIQADTYEINIDRGIDIDSQVFAKPSIGTANVRINKKSLSDLLNGSPYKSNQPFRIRYKPLPDTAPTTFETIFYGLIQNVAMKYNQDSKTLDIEITANDFMKVFLGTQVTSFTISGTTNNRSFRNVMTNLGSAVTAVDSRVALVQNGSGGSGTTQWATVLPPTADGIATGEILNLLLDAELGWAWARKSDDDILYMTRVDVDTKQATYSSWSSSAPTISNVHSSSLDHYCMNNFELTYDSDDLVNKVKANLYDAGTFIASVTSTNATSVANDGEQRAEYDITFDNTGLSTLGAWATQVSNAASLESVKSVSCPAIRTDGKVSNLAKVEIGDVQQIEFASTGLTTLQEKYMTSRINHYITPQHWEITLGLWRGI
jgi:hypothetical protein